MKVIIDIPEKYLNSNIIDVTLFTGANNTITDVNVEDECAEFQILPEGHGDLIDRDVANKELGDISYGDDLLRYVPTVIPADK